MIIGFDASRAFIKNRTGTENYSYQLLIHLAKINHDNQYIVYLRPPVDLKTILSSNNWPSNFQFIILNSQLLWTQAGLAFQTFKDPLDALFVPAHTLPLIRKPGLKTIMTVHDLGAEFLPQSHQLKQRLYLNFMTKYQLKSADHLIAVSKATKTDIIKKTGISANKISVIYEGFSKNIEENDQKTESFSDILKYYEIEKNNYFLFVGTIQPRKNLERLIRAYAIFLKSAKSGTTKKYSAAEHEGKVDGFGSDGRETNSSEATGRPSGFLCSDEPKLILAGGKGWMSDEIFALPKKLGIENQVKFLGFVPNKHLPALYSSATAFLFPSLFEGFGLPILEAFNYGCPVLTSNTTSLPEVAGKAALLVNPNSEEEIAQGIKKLFQDQKLRNKLKIEGIAQLKKFSWEKCAQETLKLFEVNSKQVSNS
jgi:glycosyltransferase involved in cell wall biosynthesis